MCGGIIMVIFKFFTVGDYEKLEHWINKMCFKGYALKDYSFGRFYFEPCIENEYYYSIELFENLPSSLSSEDFFNYLNDECNIEYVCKFLEEKSQRESLVCSQILAKKYLTLKGF